ncbi:hypothetical protein F511_27515 [Dorcoceras hygrometricum]|uniref:CRAL-TRIO domain-containing protein n=1 Tax=Dorcoceras hygrometricum TaxID=472368 RepID=A0A2Z7AX71_9LAMI|nr:hypothetical protein F511_27515 [Dorcoceras hygrometricum]
MSQSLSISSGSKSYSRKPLVPITSLNHWKIGKGAGVQIASFLIKAMALEMVRRFSRPTCPFIWSGLQALQIVCYPPFKWIQRWSPFGMLVKAMQMLSRPLLVLSIVDAFSDHSDSSNPAADSTANNNVNDDSQACSDSQIRSSSLQCSDDMRIGNEKTQGMLSTGWFCNLCKELENQGISLPERLNEEELQRFYVAANGDSSSLLLSVKKTIRWRETYRLLSEEELEMWSNMVFWHGFDVKHRPCLIVRLGLACITLSSLDRPCFVQAVVSQVEHGVLYLVDRENHQINVILDCQGLTPLKIPMQMMRHCCNLLQDHFPNVLGCLIIIRLPPILRVMAQTFIQVLKPVTKKKLRIEGEAYRKVLSDSFQTLPSYLGGQCSCTRCAKLEKGSTSRSLDSHTGTSEAVAEITNVEDFSFVEPNDQYDTLVDNSCSQTLRSAVIGILILWVLIAFIEGIYDPSSRPYLPP